MQVSSFRLRVLRFQSFQGFNFSKSDEATSDLRLELCELIVNLRAVCGVVNSQIVVQSQKRGCGFYDKPKHAESLY